MTRDELMSFMGGYTDSQIECIHLADKQALYSEHYEFDLAAARDPLKPEVIVLRRKNGADPATTYYLALFEVVVVEISTEASAAVAVPILEADAA